MIILSSGRLEFEKSNVLIINISTYIVTGKILFIINYNINIYY